MHTRLLVIASAVFLVVAGSGCEGPQSRFLGTPLDVRGKPVEPEPTNSALVVSSEEWEDMSSQWFGVVEVTFQNHSKDWIHVRATSIRFGSEAVDKAVYLPTGDDLWAWQQATLRRNALRGNNRRLALAAIAQAGVLTSVLGGPGRTMGSAGGLVALTSVAALQMSDANASSDRSATTQVFPSGHLFGELISVPPGLFAKRWIVFYTPETQVTGCLSRMQLGYQPAGGAITYVRLPFRDDGARSEWQAEACSGGAGSQGFSGAAHP